jgi:hypothetical protein
MADKDRSNSIGPLRIRKMIDSGFQKVPLDVF